jgi:hypothetical protein
MPAFKIPSERAKPEYVPGSKTMHGITSGALYEFKVYPYSTELQIAGPCAIQAVWFLMTEEETVGVHSLFAGYVKDASEALSLETELGTRIRDWEATHILVCPIGHGLSEALVNDDLSLLRGEINRDLQDPGLKHW